MVTFVLENVLVDEFTAGTDFTFHFINHSNTPIQYNLNDLGDDFSRYNINGNVVPGAQVDAPQILFAPPNRALTIEQGSVSVLTLPTAPVPQVRFWSGIDLGGRNQFINLLAGNGYTVTQDSSSFNEITGWGFRITVDGGGQDPDTDNIFFQVYNA